MEYVKKVLNAIKKLILCTLILMIIGMVILALTATFGLKTIFILDGVVIIFLIVRAIFRKIRN